MQKLLTRIFNRLMKSWSWVLLVLLTIGIKWVSWYPEWVEANYSQGLYPRIATFQRYFFGWLPFSAGDLFYAFLILVILFQTGKFLRLLFRKKLTRTYFSEAAQQGIFFLLFIYVFFNLLWGLNYNRTGIAGQLQLQVKPYSLADLDTLTSVLQEKMNHYASFVSRAQRDSFNRKKMLFVSAAAAYKAAEKEYPFLAYQPRSLKPSLYSYLGNYLGFQGYYNPFSGEGQVNTTIPRFLEPFVSTHEIAHQLGYAKENEANFVAFLACKSYESDVFRYSMYLDMYNYALGEVYSRDTLLARRFQEKAHPQVIKDQREYRDFYRRHKNPVEELVMWGYSHFLRANNQPAGKRSYNEVVAWLVAYYKKFGVGRL
ncbi:MAG: DUF3810 domain-containing protein [Chitinophagaceae bacterium]|nr:DUF3810 domain-containing protein [Chitinophagaceae bacterium]